MTDLLQTPLHAWHAAHGGRLVDFAGWSMPVQYTSIVDEHLATRSAVGVFDVSHMGRLRFDGPQSASYLDGLLTRRAASLPQGAVRYSLVTNEQGGILDDVLIYHVPAERPYHLLVVNAGNRQKILQWLADHPGQADTAMTDLTVETAMIAVQGPAAVACVEPLLDVDLAGLKYYQVAGARVAGCEGLVSRTGYTGEDGCELIVPASSAEAVWQAVMDRPQQARAAGLGARDTLRLEAAMPLYGHELSEQIDPYQAGLGFAVQLKDRQFIGRDALQAIRQRPPQRVRVGLQLAGRRLAREHCAVLRGGQAVGEVTSGTFSPTLQRPIAMAYVTPDCGQAGLELEIDIRGRNEAARVVELPFYQRHK